MGVLGVGLATMGVPYLVGEEVVEVMDGDTFKLRNNQFIRLFGADAPEIGNCFGDEARERLTQLILEKKVFIREPVTDTYRRVVALVYLGGELINEKMVREGYAVYTRSGGSETEAMKKANEHARENSLGIFQPRCYQKDPPDPKCKIKGNLDRDKKLMVYMTPACLYYDKTVIEQFRGERWFCSVDEAVKAGFVKSVNCK